MTASLVAVVGLPAPAADAASSTVNAGYSLQSATVPRGSTTVALGAVPVDTTSMSVKFVASAASATTNLSAFIGTNGPAVAVGSIAPGATVTKTVDVRVPQGHNGRLTLQSSAGSVRVDSAVVAVKQSVLIASGGSKAITLDRVPAGTSSMVLEVWASGATKNTVLSATVGGGGAKVTRNVPAGAGSGGLMTLPVPASPNGTITLSSSASAIRVYATVKSFVVGSAPAAPVAPTTPPVSSNVTTSMPGATNTGVPKGTALRVHTGDLTITQAGQVVSGLDVRGLVFVKAPNVTIQNSVIRGRVTPGNAALLSNDSSGLRVIDTEMYSANPSWKIKGFVGSNTTFTRVNVHDVTDQIHITGSNVSVQASWLHRNLHYANDPNNGGPTHDDNIQIQGGSNMRFTGNRLEGATNAAVQITQDSAVVSNVVLSGNYLNNGSCTVNVNEKARGAVKGVSILDNSFGRDTKYGECSIITTAVTKPHLNVQRNYYSDRELVDINVF